MLEALGTAQWVGPVPGGGECQATSQLLIPKRRELCVHSPVCPGTGTRREVVPVAHHQSDSLCCYLEALHRPAPTQWLPAPPAGWQQRKASSVLLICITLCKHAKKMSLIISLACWCIGFGHGTYTPCDTAPLCFHLFWACLQIIGTALQSCHLTPDSAYGILPDGSATIQWTPLSKILQSSRKHGNFFN